MAAHFAIPALQRLSPRSTFIGGWPLALSGTGGGCPADTPVACVGGSSLNTVCCPSGQTCIASSSSAYCCPSTTDCGTAVKNFPVCANSAWIMFVGPESDYFCCEQSQIGVHPTTGWDGLCEPAGQAVPTNLLAKTATQDIGSSTSPTTTLIGSVSSTTTAGPESSSTSTTEGPSLTTTSSGASTGSSTSSSSSSSSSSSAPDTAQAPVLSIGGIIGIVIGALGVLLLLCILIVLLRRRKPQALTHLATPVTSKPMLPMASPQSSGNPQIYNGLSDTAFDTATQPPQYDTTLDRYGSPQSLRSNIQPLFHPDYAEMGDQGGRASELGVGRRET